MLLRDHPLLTHQNIRTWPPAWLYCVGFDNTYPLGEVGILKTVFVSAVKPSTRCFLIMEHVGIIIKDKMTVKQGRPSAHAPDHY